MIQIRKEENQKKQKEKKLKVYKVNTHKKTVIALWVLLAVSFLFAVYKNFTAIDIHTVHETKVIEEQILDTHKIENFVENFAEVYYSWEQSAASIDNRTNALKGYLTGFYGNAGDGWVLDNRQVSRAVHIDRYLIGGTDGFTGFSLCDTLFHRIGHLIMLSFNIRDFNMDIFF